MFNDDRLGEATPSTWNETEAQNYCEFSEYVDEIPLFRDFANEIKFPRSVLLDEQVRTHCLYRCTRVLHQSMT
jgi:hypothetical protein